MQSARRRCRGGGEPPGNTHDSPTPGSPPSRLTSAYPLWQGHRCCWEPQAGSWPCRPLYKLPWPWGHSLGAGQGQPLSWAVLLPLWPPGSSRADRPLSSLRGTPEQLLKGAWSRPFCPRAPGTVHTGSPRTLLWAWSCPVRYGMFCNISGFPYPRNPKDVSRKTKCPLVATEEPWPGPPVGWGRGGEAWAGEVRWVGFCFISRLWVTL